MNLASTSLATPPKSAIGICQSRSAHPIENIEDLLAIVESVQERSKTAQVHHVGPEPEQVARYPVEFRCDHADVLGAFGDLDSGKLLHGENEPVVVDHPGQVVHSAGIGEKLAVKPIFTHLLMSAMAVSDYRV